METETLTLKRDENWGVPANTVEDAEFIFDAFRDLRYRAIPIANALLKLEHGFDSEFEEYEIEFDEDGFIAAYEYYRCGDSETFTVRIPLSYLFDPDWLDQANAKIEARRKEEEERKERERLAQIERQKKAEYKQYMKLKEKFEK